ncbi:MAG: ATP-binding protein, partial [Marmoricola sp.]
ALVTSRELPPFLVKGKSKPVTAVVVEDVSEALRSPLASNDLPLVGREAELAELRAIVGEVGEGRGRAVEILGEAGVGKSRLIAEVADDERIFQQVKVECQPYHTNTAYAAAKVILRRLVGISYSASAEEAGRLLQRTVSRVRPELLPMLPLLAVPLDATVDPTPEVDALATDFVLARTHESVVDLLTVMVGTPTLFLVEDAYYADPASAGLFSALAQQIADRPWLLFATNRPDSRLLLTGVTSVHRMDLEPLGEGAAVELATAAFREMAGGSDAAAALAAVADRAGGNPLFVLELMQAVREGVATEDLPESVERIVAERLDRLGANDRTLLRYAAVVGARFDTELLDLVLTSTGQRPSDPQIWDALADLVERDGEHHVRFRHVLYRDVAYGGLPFGRRGRLHQRVGELIEASSQASDVALLGEHFFRAGDYERTWRYSVAAGDRAWNELAVAEAAVAYERALDVRRHVRGLAPKAVARVCEALGDVRERTAAYDDADKQYLAASKVRPADPAAEARLLRKRGNLREKTGRYPLALRWYDRGLAANAAAGHGQADAPLMVAAAGALFRMGRQAEALRTATEAVDHAERVGDTESEAHACLVVQACNGELGQVADIGYGQRSLALFTELGNVQFQGKALNNLGVALYFRGEWSPAAEHYQQAAERFDAAGDVMEAAAARSNVGEILSDQGRTAEARLLFQQSHLAFASAGHPWGEAVTLGNLGRAQARDGDPVHALATLARAGELLAEIGSASFAVENQIRLAEAQLLAGQTEAGVALLEDLAPQVEANTGFPGSDAVLARLWCWSLRQSGHTDEALVRARSAVELAAAAGIRYERAVALNEVAALTRDPAVAEEVRAELTALGVVRLPALPLPL